LAPYGASNPVGAFIIYDIKFSKKEANKEICNFTGNHRDCMGKKHWMVLRSQTVFFYFLFIFYFFIFFIFFSMCGGHMGKKVW